MATHERMAMLLSMSSFERFYGKVMHLTCEQYLSTYRNDFSFVYAHALAALEMDVIIYCPAWTCSGLHRLEEGIYVRFLAIADWYKLWDRYRSLSRTPIGRYISEYANAKAFRSSLMSGLLEDEVSVLYVQEYWTGRFDYLVRTVSRPIIGADHGGRRTRQLAFFKRKSFRLASAITCQTKDEVMQVRCFNKEARLLPNGVDVRFYSPLERGKRTQVVLIVARLADDQKRVSDLIMAMRYLPQPWSLQIAGSGPDEEKLRRLADELGVGQRIDFLGFIGDKTRLRELYRECGVFCMPSAYEGLPLAILEAMSCGCAVVVTSIRAFEGLVEHEQTGYKVPVEDPKQLAIAIERAWDQRERLGVAARKAVERNNSIEAIARSLRSLVVQVARDAAVATMGGDPSGAVSSVSPSIDYGIEGGAAARLNGSVAAGEAINRVGEPLPRAGESGGFIPSGEVGQAKIPRGKAADAEPALPTRASPA
jgi:glycosyltransferase involved in cell wall biosynthesis